MYMMLSGNPCFAGKTVDMIVKKNLKGTVSFDEKEWTDVSALAVDFMKKILEIDP